MRSKWGPTLDLPEKKIEKYTTWLKERDQSLLWVAIQELERAGCDFKVLASLAASYWLWEPQKLQDKLPDVPGTRRRSEKTGPPSYEGCRQMFKSSTVICYLTIPIFLKW